MSAKTQVFRNGVLCVLVFLACYVVAWPVAQMGFMDDWSYIETARVFATTGHIVYNGWGSPMLGWMIPWGALFIKLFGFSFTAVKVSMLPVSLGTLLLFHSILRRFEISPRNAVIGTLTLGLSPLFLPLSASFMTDMPGLFATLLCLYLCQRALSAETDRAAIGWLAAAALSNVVGGTARQVAWLGVLVMVPCTAWLLRKRRRVLAGAIALWGMGVVAVLGCMHWFAQQPYIVPVPLLPQMTDSMRALSVNSILTADLIMAQGLCLLLMIFPVLAAWLPEFGKKFDDYLAVFCLGLIPLAAMRVLMGRLAEIWPPNILLAELQATKQVSIGGLPDLRQSLAPYPVQFILSLFLVAAALACGLALQNRGYRAVWCINPTLSRRVVGLLAPYMAAYSLLLLPMIWQGASFDRYMLGLMPCAIVIVLWLYQTCAGPRLPRLSVVLLVLFAAVSVAGTHNWFAWQRARLAAINELRQAGVPRDRIQGGFEYEGWTQIHDGGYVNRPGLENPKGAYKKDMRASYISPGCENYFLRDVPDVHPLYSVAVAPLRCYLPSRFAPVHYTAWLPPFRRVVEVQRVPGA